MRSISVNPQEVNIRKYSSGGTLLFERFAVSASQLDARHLAVDSNQNVFVMGEVISTTSFPAIFPSLTISNETGNRYLDEVQRFRQCGLGQTIRRVHGGLAHPPAPASPWITPAIALSVAASSSPPFQLDGVTLTNGGTPAGGSYPANMFLAKIAPTGELLWTRKTTGTGSSYASDVALDAEGNSYVTGPYVGDVAFGAGSIPYAGGTPMFLVKYDPAGTPLWVNSAGGDSSRFLNNRIEVSPAGNCYLAGRFDSAIPGGIATVSLERPRCPRAATPRTCSWRNTTARETFIGPSGRRDVDRRSQRPRPGPGRWCFCGRIVFGGRDLRHGDVGGAGPHANVSHAPRDRILRLPPRPS
jgi:hypothetical protein